MKFFKHLFSGWFMGVLLLALATAIGYATFLENDFGAEASKLVVYNARWFEAILLLMIINFSGMIFTKKLYKKGKLNILLIHISLIIIIIGAGITRYYSFEGQMHIREGETSNTFLSAKTYFQVYSALDDQPSVDLPVFLTEARQNLVQGAFDANGTNIEATLVQYIPNAQEVLVDAESGEAYLNIIIGGMEGRYQVFLKEGTKRLFYDIGFSFGDTTNPNLVQFMRQGDKLFVRLPKTFSPEGKIEKKPIKPLELKKPYRLEDVGFVVQGFKESGAIAYQKAFYDNYGGPRMALVQLNNEKMFVPFGEEVNTNVDGQDVVVKIDYKQLELPFNVRLEDFDIERYPGSKSPSSFASDVVIIDEDNETEFEYSIYMNHILDYAGYRFFQSSYDQDELGTVLTVNHDYWGSTISYAGYFLLFASLIIAFFTPKTRFSRITQQLKEVHNKRKKLVASVLVILFSLAGFNNLNAQDNKGFQEHAKKFGTLYVQNHEGRMEPINTLSNKVLVKIHKKDHFEEMSADEVILSMALDKEKWKNVPLIKVSEESIQKELGITSNYASFSDFTDEKGSYKLSKSVEEANSKKPALRTQHDKGVINVDERLNVMFMVLNGGMLKIFPIKDDPSRKWVTPKEHHKILGHGTDDGDLFEAYAKATREAIELGDFSAADEALSQIAAYQQEFGAEILPSPAKLKLELFYNGANIFKRLFPFYLLIGSVLVGMFFLKTFKPSFEFNGLRNVLLVILVLAFVVQTVGLGIRWYISGHAPWSNGYESMIYISWATMLAGFVFMKRSAITLGVTAMLAGITLFTAHMSWLNPELTNLVPVLKSYWLTIHVATITASYGFLGLGGMVGFLNLCIMIFRNNENKKHVNLALTELMLIIEMAITVGLVLLVIGNFLGGIWANESWGRYWGWDPKESWTLVTILLYTFTLHLTLIPSLRNKFTFSFFSFISFGGVLMTYFGVNYYLSGLHSYAAGDPLEIPSALYYAIAVIFVVSLLAAFNEIKMKKAAKAKKIKKKAN